MAAVKPFGPAKSAGLLLLLVWNLIGVGFFFYQATMDLYRLAAVDPYQAHMFATMPLWAWVGYAVGVFAGTAGAVLLLRHRRLATWLFAVSLLGILVQFGRAFLLTDLLEVKGWGSAAFPAFIIAVAVLSIVLSRHLRARGYLF